MGLFGRLLSRGGQRVSAWMVGGVTGGYPACGGPARSVGVLRFPVAVPFQCPADAVGPKGVTERVEVESVGNEQFGSGPALGVEHGGGDVNVGELWVGGGEVLNHLVGALGQGPEVLAGGAGFDGYEVDVGLGQSAVGFADKRFEFEEELFGRFAGGDVIVALVNEDLPGCVAPDESVGQSEQFVHLGSAEAAIDDVAVGKGVGQIVPESEAGAADEEGGAGGRWVSGVPGVEGGEFGGPFG